MGIGAYTAALLTTHTAALPFFFAAHWLGRLLPALIALVIGRPTLQAVGSLPGHGDSRLRRGRANLDSQRRRRHRRRARPQRHSAAHRWFDVRWLLALRFMCFCGWRMSRIGRTMTAICQDEIATELMGLNVRAYKLFAFVFGAALAGLAGALNAHFTFFISPNEYGFERGVEILAMGVLGGTGSPWGAVIGAASDYAFAGVPARARPLSAADQWRHFDRDHSLFAQRAFGIFCNLSRAGPRPSSKLAMLTLSSVSKDFGGLQVLARYQLDDS